MICETCKKEMYMEVDRRGRHEKIYHVCFPCNDVFIEKGKMIPNNVKRRY